MKVSEVMSRGLDPIAPSATVQAAATMMAELDVGALVVGTPAALEGVVTDRDIILRLVVAGLHPAEVAVRDVMTVAVHAARADDPVETAFSEMRERQIRRMPVYDESGRPIGIVTLGDLVKGIKGPEQMAGVLRDLLEPHRTRKSVADPGEPAGGVTQGRDAAGSL